MSRKTQHVQWHVYGLFVSFLFIPMVAAEPVATGSREAKESCRLPTPITSEALVELALTCSARQKALLSKWRAQEKRVVSAGSLDNPSLMLSVAPNTLGDDNLDNGIIAEIRQALPWPGVLSVREDVASAEANVWEARVRQDKVILARDVRQHFSQWQYHRQLLVINQQHQSLWQEFLAIVRAKYASGSTGKSKVLQATHEHHVLLEEAIELRSLVERDVSQLKGLINLPSDSLLESVEFAQPVIELSNSLNDFFENDAINVLFARINQQPQLRELLARQEKKKGELSLAEKARKPSFSLMTKYNGLWMNKEQRWVVGVGFNLPFASGKRRSQEASLRAEQDSIRWERQDRELQLREQIVQALSHWQQAREIYQLYLNNLLPLAEESLVTAQDEYQSGAGDFLSLLTAQRQALTTQRKATMVERDQLIHFAHLTAAAGLVQLTEWNSLRDGHE